MTCFSLKNYDVEVGHILALITTEGIHGPWVWVTLKLTPFDSEFRKLKLKTFLSKFHEKIAKIAQIT